MHWLFFLRRISTIMMLGVVRRSTLSKLCIHNARKMSTMTMDITGNPFRTTSNKAAWTWDEALIDILSSNKDARPLLKEIVQADASSNLCKILILFENLRYSMNYHYPEMTNSFLQIEALLTEGKLSRREGYYAAAALAWYEGNYMKSGVLLETSLINTRGDLVAARLAQDAYIVAGSPNNVLNSVIRHPSNSETAGHLQGYLLSMISNGYVEVGQLKQAEDEGERAVEATKGQNSWALHALLNCYQIQGRSSEINAKLEEHISKHEGNGLANLLFNRGSAHIQRGNYSGAFKVVEELVELLEAQYKLGNNSHSSVIWSHAVLLLWNLCLNTSDLNDVVFTPLWKILGKYQTDSVPLHDLCSSMVLSSLSTNKSPSASPRVPPATPTPPAEAAPKEELVKQPQGAGGLVGIWKSLTGSSKFKSKQSYTPGETGDGVENFQYIAKHIAERFKPSEYKELGLKVNYEGLYQAHISKLQSPRGALLACPKLRSILPSANLVHSARVALVRPDSTSLDGSAQTDLSDLEFSRREFVVPFSMAVKQFTQEQYPQANDVFLQHTPVVNLLGGTALQRDLGRQMSVESAFRANNIERAYFMLRERSVLVPNDAQCWRRLASIYGNSGQRELATRAHYTAWTLGIEQGGFGGMR